MECLCCLQTQNFSWIKPRSYENLSAHHPEKERYKSIEDDVKLGIIYCLAPWGSDSLTNAKFTLLGSRHRRRITCCFRLRLPPGVPDNRCRGRNRYRHRNYLEPCLALPSVFLRALRGEHSSFSAHPNPIFHLRQFFKAAEISSRAGLRVNNLLLSVLRYRFRYRPRCIKWRTVYFFREEHVFPLAPILIMTVAARRSASRSGVKREDESGACLSFTNSHRVHEFPGGAAGPPFGTAIGLVSHRRPVAIIRLIRIAGQKPKNAHGAKTTGHLLST